MNNICNCFLVNVIYNSLVVSIKMHESDRYGPVAIIVARQVANSVILFVLFSPCQYCHILFYSNRDEHFCLVFMERILPLLQG